MLRVDGVELWSFEVCWLLRRVDDLSSTRRKAGSGRFMSVRSSVGLPLGRTPRRNSSELGEGEGVGGGGWRGPGRTLMRPSKDNLGTMSDLIHYKTI